MEKQTDWKPSTIAHMEACGCDPSDYTYIPEPKQDWYCPKCKSYVSSESVTFEENHQICNTSVINKEEEPKQETQGYDKYNQVLSEGDYVDVQKDGVQLIYKKEDNQLYFKPYGKEDRVSAYFSNDLAKCDEVGNWINNDRYEIIIPKEETLEEAAWRVFGDDDDNFYDGAKWQAKRSYSEEDMLQALNIGFTSTDETWEECVEFAKEQFKKK